MINLKDLLRNGKPEDEEYGAWKTPGGEQDEPGAPDAMEARDAGAGAALVPDFVKPETPRASDDEQQRAETPDGEAQGGEASAMGVSLISKEATVLGDIITEGHIDVVGKVRGNVEAEGNIAIRGLVSGDLSGEKIGLYQCRVKGNLKAGAGVVIDSDSVVIGNIDTENVVLGGKLKGDIKAVKMAVLRSDAYFIGDVETESLAVESGAVVNGNIRTIVQGDIEAPFDD